MLLIVLTIIITIDGNEIRKRKTKLVLLLDVKDEKFLIFINLQTKCLTLVYCMSQAIYMSFLRKISNNQLMGQSVTFSYNLWLERKIVENGL